MQEWKVGGREGAGGASTWLNTSGREASNTATYKPPVAAS